MAAINALVVDDSGIMRKLVMRALRDSRLAEFNFTEAVDGADALAKFAPETIQWVFVDWNMPNMNGIEFIRKLREKEKEHVTVVMITTERTVGKVEEAMTGAGVDAYICKPFTADVLVDKLRPLFARPEAAQKKEAGFFSRLVGQMG